MFFYILKYSNLRTLTFYDRRYRYEVKQLVNLGALNLERGLLFSLGGVKY
jgi:hypothetical protein